MKYFSTLSETKKAFYTILFSHIVATVLCLPLLLWYGVWGFFLLPTGLEEIINSLFGMGSGSSFFFVIGVYYLVFGLSLYYAKKDPTSLDFRVLRGIYFVLLGCSLLGFMSVVIHSI